MKILKLVAENFKKLSAVEITPDGNMVVISGKNAAGKSSVLDAIEATLCGGKMAKKPIKEGEIRAKTEVLMDGYKVTRKFFGASSTLTVETTGETKAKISSPQAFLDDVVGNLSFDPLAFLNKQPAEQRNTLMDFLGLNLEDFANKIATIKTQRSEIRKDKERFLCEAESLVLTPNLPPQVISSESLLGELANIRTHNQQCQAITTERAVTQTQLAAIETDIEAANAALEQWQDRVKKLQASRINVVQNLASNPEIQTIDPAEIEGKLKSLEATNAAIRTNVKKQNAITLHQDCITRYAELGDEIKIVENQKTQKLAETVMPVKELTILPDGLGYKGLPLEQECDSGKLKICVAIAMAMNPKLKVLRINGNELDSDSLVAIGELVADKDYQIWIERVSDDNEIGFYIEDGQLTGGKNEKETN